MKLRSSMLTRNSVTLIAILLIFSLLMACSNTNNNSNSSNNNSPTGSSGSNSTPTDQAAPAESSDPAVVYPIDTKETITSWEEVNDNLITFHSNLADTP